ncbi:MAG: 3'(2'),5'-bisphosphate nucleotidase CysQ [Pseudomonadota bacterium]
MPGTDLPLLIDAVRHAGEIALGYAGKTARRWDKPDGAGPVTEADLAVNDSLKTALQAARPDYGWLSEESEDGQDRLSRDALFIIDPIDGTRSFTEGSRTWAISVAAARQNEITAAVVYLPARDMLYVAAIGAGAQLNGKQIRVADSPAFANAQVLANKPALAAKYWRDGSPTFKRHYRPSLAYRLALVAEGRFDGMLTLHPCWEWDVAAGALLISEAGGKITTRDGAPLRFNNPDAKVDGVLAGAARLQTEMLSALSDDPLTTP